MTQATGSDFNLFIGEWNVKHRRLSERLSGSDDWQEFGGVTTVRPILNGTGNMDDNVLHLPGGSYNALSLRTYNPSTGQWAIWWLDGRTPHTLDVPVLGQFKSGTGTFFAEDTFDGKSIMMRFMWTRTATSSPRWEQAFSLDNGSTWETNWIMDFTRKLS